MLFYTMTKTWILNPDYIDSEVAAVRQISENLRSAHKLRGLSHCTNTHTHTHTHTHIHTDTHTYEEKVLGELGELAIS